MNIEVLYFAGCPGYERLLADLRELAADSGAQLTHRAIETVEAAAAERFLGSPTVRVNGQDVDPGAKGRDDYGLKCRIYRPGRGQQSAVPPLTWIRAALTREAG